MIDFKIEPFQMKYLNQVIKVWNDNLVYDTISEGRFNDLVLLDDNFDEKLFKLAVNDEKVLGFAYGIKRKVPYLERGLEPLRGWISIMAVDEKVRRNGIGTKLVEEVEKDLKELGATNITLCAYSPNYFTPGVDLRYTAALPFFDKLGYTKGSQEEVSMQRNLAQYSYPKEIIERRKALEKEGIVIKRYEQKYMLQLLTFLLDNFGAGWKRNAFLAMQKHEAEDTILICVDKTDTIIGYCMRKIDGNDGRFGPFGVREDLRSKGLGSILYETMMNDMRQRGVYSSYLLWTGGAAQRFYERHDTQVYRTYTMYRREI